VIRLSLRDMQFRAAQFLTTALATSVVFSVVLVMNGLSGQFTTEAKSTVLRFGADRWVVEDRDGGAFTSRSVLPETMADDLVTSGAASTTGPVAIGLNTVRLGGKSRLVRTIGYVPGRLGAPRLVQGRLVDEAGEMVATRESGLQLGNTVEVGRRTLRVVGLTARMTVTGGLPLLFVHLSDAQEIMQDGHPVATAVLVRGPLGPLPDGYKAMTPDETSADSVRPMEVTMSALRLIALLLWGAGTVLIGAFVYVSAIGRLRDFAVLKALGGSAAQLLRGVAVQSLLLALAAAATGAGLANLYIPRFPVYLDPPKAAYVQLILLAAGSGLLASFGGIRKAVRVEPAVAFRAAGG
jgi:putative ABC transport system permease protein